MKYLKLFEEIDIEQTNTKCYSKISKLEFLNFRHSHVLMDVPVDDMKKIKNYLNNGLWNYVHKFSGMIPFEIINQESKYIQLKSVKQKNTNPTAHIGYWNDEYYTITYTFQIVNSFTKYYLCDQIDGILEFIEDLNNGKI